VRSKLLDKFIEELNATHDSISNKPFRIGTSISGDAADGKVTGAVRLMALP
jgi:hypothetical protein